MTADRAHEELQDLVDHLPPAEARRILRLVIGELEAAGSRGAVAEVAPRDDIAARRRLSFAGIIEDEPDAARRSERILSEGLRRGA